MQSVKCTAVACVYFYTPEEGFAFAYVATCVTDVVCFIQHGNGVNIQFICYYVITFSCILTPSPHQIARS